MEFKDRLRALRREKGWTQESLADRLHVTVETIRNWESGRTRHISAGRALEIANVFALTGIEHEQLVALALGRNPDAAPPAVPVARRELPRDTNSFTGRETELNAMAKALADSTDPGDVVRVCVLRGLPGVGKTGLATHFAHSVAGNYPGGQFFLELYGHSAHSDPVDPGDGLSALLIAAGVPRTGIPDGVDERARLWRSWTAEHKALLLLDDARDAAQVKPFLPGTAGNLVLITTRHWLPALLDATDIPVWPMKEEDAARLLTAIADRPGVEPNTPGVADLVELCGGLPLVIRPLAAQLKKHPRWSPSYLRDSIVREGSPLGLRVDDRDTIRDVFSLSYKNLTEPLKRLFRYLALHPGPDADRHAVAALLHTDSVTADGVIEDLLDYHLIDEVGPDRYKFHALIREYARELAACDEADEREAAERRLLGYYLHTARAADGFLARWLPAGIPDDGRMPPPQLAPFSGAPPMRDRQDALRWLDDNRDRLDAAARYAAGHGYREYATLVPTFLEEYLLRRGHWDQCRDLHQLALEAADDEPLARARALLGLGSMRYLRNDPAGAAGQLREAASIFGDLGDIHGHARALRKLGATDMALGNYAEALRAFSELLPLFEQADDLRAAAETLSYRGVAQFETGDIAGAFTSQSAARDAFAKLKNPVGEANALCYLGEIHRLHGRFAESVSDINAATTLYGEDSWSVAGAQYFLGATLLAAGRLAEAGKELADAQAQYHKSDDQFDEAGVLNQIGLLHTALRQYPEATVALETALCLYDDYGSPPGVLEVLNGLGELAPATGSHVDAEDYHRRALGLARAMQVPREEARARLGLGHAARYAGRPAEAAEHFRSARARYEQLGSPMAALLREQGLA
jgi:tetratricopeptide (TPR) repeat protein/transcriptional regulator with XRE-family HTH domain